ncbi:melanotransferrin isoform X2 [Phlebotomus papatasi]|uniref:melanotransferrin isoform X2 n=1 Tax=Phlebotomus papatasi TaxID=29031 RepID=UPI002484285A|nr:melanotransferrin isoform X2 [Phlebotomus papatasi]
MFYFRALALIVTTSFLTSTYWSPAEAQYHHFYDENKMEKMIWCTTSQEEQFKCQNFSMALERDFALFEEDFFNVSCHQAFDKDECIILIDQDKATITSLDPGEVFQAGRYNSLVPILQETYEGGFKNYFAVAVIKTGTLSDVYAIRDLRGKQACFAGVGSQAGWTIPIYRLLTEGDMEIVDCNNHVKSAINFFGKSCAVNALVNKNNPIGDNSDKLCNLCTGVVPGGKCTAQDPYAGFEGAFRCLLEAGDVAFLKHTTVKEMVSSREFKSLTEDRFELLCPDGQKRPLGDYRQCNWGLVPADAVVVSSAKTTEERKHIERFLLKSVELYSTKPVGDTQSSLDSTTDQGNRYDYGGRNTNFGSPYSNDRFGGFGGAGGGGFGGAGGRYDPNRGYDSNRGFGGYDDPFRTTTTTTTTTRRPFGYYDNPFGVRNQTDQDDNNQTQVYERFELFDSSRYGTKLNLMFSDTARTFASIKEVDQNFAGYLGDNLEIILGVRMCPVGRMTLCVTSDAEMEKCVKMRTALKAQLIKPEMICHKGHSHINCMQAIASGSADVAVLDVSDVYTGGLTYELVPFLSEVYNLGEPEYYVVAIAKEDDPDTELTYLKGKYTCHAGINTAAGWVYPLAYLISNGWIRPYGCDSIRAAAEYFSKSCVPGALSAEYNTGIPYDNMCDLCHGVSYRYCRRDASEDYYGHTGAFRCLVEGGGHVAFAKHTTVSENTGGKRREWWARNTLNDDFQLLCPDGTRGRLNDYHHCNLGKVKANAVVTRGGIGYNETQINAYINLFTYAQQFYGRKEQDAFSFSMFYSYPPYHDLIFQDATRQLKVISPEERRYDKYVGKDFMRARRITDCLAGGSQVTINRMLIALITAFSILSGRMFLLK